MFKCIYEDTPGGKWTRRVGKGRFHFVELTDMDDACGRDNDGQPRYVVELSEVDVTATSEAMRAGAKGSCGWEGMPETTEAMAECLHASGARAPLGDWSGNNREKLMTSARKCSRELTRDPKAYEAAMSKPVNKIGSTAREFMQGDVHSAINRGVREGRQDAKIMAKMYGVKPEAIAEVEGKPTAQGFMTVIRLRACPSNDPFAYSMGWMCAMAGKGLEAERGDLAEAYIVGYQFGVDVKAGREPWPKWAKRSR